MLTDEIRRRLESLNRETLPEPRARTAVAAAPGVRFAVADERLPPGGTEVENRSGRHLRLCRRLADVLGRDLALPGSLPSADAHAELASLAAAFPRQTLFLDLETCGFAGSAIFLVGMVWHDGEALLIDQLLARTYAEERAVLETLWQVAAGQQVLVTFNGKSFDWPMVHDRSTRHLLGRAATGPAAGPSAATPLGPRDARPWLDHCDLLHHARRRWRRVLPDCRLQTLERVFCRRVRQGDVPGWMIPDAYYRFVRTRQEQHVAPIVHHNALDLATLVELAVRLLAPSPEK